MRGAYLALVLVSCARVGAPALDARRGSLPVWIDTDPAVGVPQRDVDDGLAMALAFQSPELAIRGVTVVFGNADLDQAEPIARALVAQAGRLDVGVWRGARGPTDLGSPTPATEAMVAALEREELTIFVLGPATNIATVLLLRPDLAPRIRALIAVAGRRPGQRFTTGTQNRKGHRDFNFELDPDAFRIILTAKVSLMLAPFEVASRVWLTESDLARLEGGPAFVQAMLPPAREWLALWRDVFAVDGFNPFDTLAIAAAARPELLVAEELSASIEVLPDDVTEERMQGARAKEKPYLLVRPLPGRAVRYYATASAPFKDWLMGRLLAR